MSRLPMERTTWRGRAACFTVCDIPQVGYPGPPARVSGSGALHPDL